MNEVTVKDASKAVVVAALRNIADEHEGRLLPEAIVAAATDPRSPLHDYFEWDNDTAAEGFRLVQAQALIRRVRIHVLKGDGESTKVIAVRGYASLPSARKQGIGYEALPSVLGDETKRAELVEYALGELNRVRERFATVKELDAIWSALDEIERVAPAKSRRRRVAAPTQVAAQ